MTTKKQWFNVILEANKTIRIYAEDEIEAEEKAEAKMGATWMAIASYPDNTKVGA